MMNPTNQTDNRYTGKMVVVESVFNLEREIDQHVKKIQSLINKLSPTERQKYFNGMLAYILDGQVQITNETKTKTSTDNDYSSLSENELMLLAEMADKMQELYHHVGDTQE